MTKYTRSLVNTDQRIGSPVLINLQDQWCRSFKSDHLVPYQSIYSDPWYWSSSAGHWFWNNYFWSQLIQTPGTDQTHHSPVPTKHIGSLVLTTYMQFIFKNPNPTIYHKTPGAGAHLVHEAQAIRVVTKHVDVCCACMIWIPQLHLGISTAYSAQQMQHLQQSEKALHTEATNRENCKVLFIKLKFSRRWVCLVEHCTIVPHCSFQSIYAFWMLSLSLIA